MTEKQRIRGGSLLAKALLEKGVEDVFTLAGGFLNPALEGLMERGINVIGCTHEQIAGNLADAHVRITRKPAVCLVGPEGFSNAVPAMMEAWGERSPIIFITSSSTLNRQGAGGFKEIDDVAIAAPLTKYSFSVNNGKRIGEFVDRAWKIAVSGYPGAVHISIPVDIMFTSFDEDAGYDERPFVRSARPAPRAWPDPSSLAEVLEIILQARRPILIGGHGIWWSRNEHKLEATAKQLGIPIFNMPGHRKMISQSSEVYMGLADIHQYPPSGHALDQCDVAILVGSRLDNQMNFGNPPMFPPSTRLICINGSHEELEMNRSADEVLLSDPGAFLDALADLKSQGRWQLDSSWLATNHAWRDEWVQQTLAELEKDAADGGKIHPLSLSLEVQSVLGENDWLIYDGGNAHFWSEIGVKIAGAQGKKIGGILHPSIFSVLGCGVPFALAAKNTHRNSHVILVSGDGAFLSGGMAIEMAFQENLPIVVVIDNNAGLDFISQQQETLFTNQKHCATDLRDIAFHKLFEGLGGYGELVEKRDELVPAIQRAIASGKPACVNVRTKGVVTPILSAVVSKRDKASIE